MDLFIDISNIHQYEEIKVLLSRNVYINFSLEDGCLIFYQLTCKKLLSQSSFICTIKKMSYLF